jgi:hypothetical protein
MENCLLFFRTISFSGLSVLSTRLGKGGALPKTIKQQTGSNQMNKTILLAAFSLTLLPSVHAQTAAAPASPGVLSNLSVNGTMDLESQYIFRGKKVTNAAFQPSINANWANISGGTATAYAWTSQPMSSPGAGIEQNNEVDLGIKYDNTVPSYAALGYEVGFQMYWYQDIVNPPAVGRSYEFHIGLNYDTTDMTKGAGWGSGYNLQPSLTYFHDVILDSNTLQAQLASYTFDLSDTIGQKGFTLTPTATLGWTSINRTFGDQSGGPNWANSFLYYELDLEADYKPNNTGTTTFFLGVHYAGNTDGTTGGYGAANNPQAPGSANSVWFGLGVKFNQ